MQFAVIAAGEGSRLKQEGISIPKPMVNIGDQPMIERIFKLGVESGATTIHCIINGQSAELEMYIRKISSLYPVNLIVKSTLSSMHSLYELSSFLKKEPFCLSTVDTVFDKNEFSEFIDYSRHDNNTDGIIAVTGFIDDEKPLYVKVDKNENIIEFSDVKNKNELVTGGLYFFKPVIFESLKKTINSGQKRLRNFLKMLILDNYNLKAYRFSKMIDVDHISDIKEAEKFLNKRSMLKTEIK